MSRFYTFFYLYDTEWLASSGGTKFLKSIKEMSKEELNVFLKSFYMSTRKKHGTSVYKSSSMKSIWGPSLIVSFAHHHSKTIFHNLWLLILLRQIKYWSICKRPHQDEQHCWRSPQETNFHWANEETVRQGRARTSREQKSSTAKENDLVLPRSLFGRRGWVNHRNLTPTTDLVLVKNPSMSWAPHLSWT